MVDGGLPMDPWKSCWHHPPGIYGMADELIIVFENVGIQTLGVSSWIQSIIMIACWHQIEMVDTHGAFTAHLRCKCQQICFSCRPISDWFHKPRLIDARCQPPEKWSYAIKHIIKLDDWVAHSLGHPGFNLHPPRYPKGSVSCTAASRPATCQHLGVKIVKSECPWAPEFVWKFKGQNLITGSSSFNLWKLPWLVGIPHVQTHIHTHP